MKKFIIAALAASVLATPVLAAPNNGHFDDRGRGRVEQNHGFDNRRDTRTVVVRRDVGRPQAQHRNWQRGQRFDSRYASNYRVIANPRQYRLHEAPRGYRWVQSGNDAVLIGITSGIVASVLANMVR